MEPSLRVTVVHPSKTRLHRTVMRIGDKKCNHERRITLNRVFMKHHPLFFQNTPDFRIYLPRVFLIAAIASSRPFVFAIFW